MGRIAGFIAVVVILARGGCGASGPSGPELTALQTQVAQQATQLSELRGQVEAQSSAAAVPPATPTEVAAQASPTGVPGPSPTAMQPVPVGTVVSGGEGADSGPCELIAVEQVTVYERAHVTAAVFGIMAAGDRVQPQARTADGWWGFDPAVAQAANVGIFRLRWVQETASIRLEGSCGEVPEVMAPPPGVCFTMPMEDVQILASPDPSAEVVATLGLGDYAEVLGTTADGWAQVDLASGNMGLALTGWMPDSALNMNGPCENLPTLEPW
jgi:hypothetical protein